MSIQSLSFFQQDQNYWNQSQSVSQSLAQSDALITAMGTAMTNQASGLASIANQEALKSRQYRADSRHTKRTPNHIRQLDILVGEFVVRQFQHVLRFDSFER